mmetsp:Transcript_107336/g.298518  ORF Transcript_107336/g.298518 Transcript_107336/m.298518 type:complete len:90 (-) Transcript_107336:148-417(-)
MSFITNWFEARMEKPGEMAAKRRENYEQVYSTNGFYTRHYMKDAVRSTHNHTILPYDEEYVLGVHSWHGGTKLYAHYLAETAKRKEEGH